MKEVLETREIGGYDVAVCGGGIAGIAAALAAARHNARVLLIEKQYLLGGLATSGLVTFYLPLCDGTGRQVSFGIAEELLRLSVKDGAENPVPRNWFYGEGGKTEKDKRFETSFNAQVFAVLCEKLLLGAGVDVLYGDSVVGAKTNAGKLTHVIVEGKSGRRAYAVKSAVDATGDCDLANLAGAKTNTYEQGNVLAAWYYFAGKDGYKLKCLGSAEKPKAEQEEGYKLNMLVNKRFTGVTSEELSEMTVLSHDASYNDWKAKRENDDSLWPVTFATIPLVRMTRKLVGESEMKNADDKVYMPDSVGMVSNWKTRGPVYEVPFGSLYSKSLKNVAVAGRCVSCTEQMWDVMRVIPCCAVTGQAAGTAAAMSDDFGSLDISALQSALKRDGVVLHEKDL